ncbi:MAG: tRNA dihydrouridine synthase DusB [Lachnospiraceae bacterium]|nr:tRNA dihydrouridine synthase DusB [Lachnospiraceae bacterium]
MVRIGNVELKNRWILAPMAGVCDLPFRVLCTREGAGMTCMEMVSAKAIFYNNKNTDLLMEISDEEDIVSLQLFGSDPDIMGDMAARIEERPFSILDINMGCPVPKVVNNHEGSALMKDPLLAGRIIERVAKSIKKPLTIKIRKGFDEAHVNAVEMAHIAQESGAAAVAVHGRTRDQYYSGEADWDIIRQVKEAVSIPVIGNGDVRDVKSAHIIIEETGCDAVMIGRACQGNPWIFKALTMADEGLAYEGPTIEERKRMILLHGKMLIDCKGEYIGIREMRRHAAWYTQGLPGSSKFRGRMNEMESYDDLVALVEDNFW